MPSSEPIDVSKILAEAPEIAAQITELNNALIEVIVALATELEGARTALGNSLQTMEEDEIDMRRQADRIARVLALGGLAVPADTERPTGTPAYIRGYLRCFTDVRLALSECDHD